MRIPLCGRMRNSALPCVIEKGETNTMKRTQLLLAMALLATTSAYGQTNPCNPCGGQAAGNPQHPRGDEMAVNPCYAKMGAVFYVDDPMERNTVTFKSEAPLEDIVGTTSQITGYLVFDPDNPTQGGRGELRVAVGSLNTGIPLRDEHLRSADWLDAERYPHAILTITDVQQVKKVKSSRDFQTYDVLLIGEFSLHGKTRQLEIPGRLTYLKESPETRQKMEGDLLAVRASFSVDLADFGVTGPRGAGLIGTKVGGRIEVEVSFVGSTGQASMAMNPRNPRNPCGGKAANPCNPCGR